MSDQPVLLSREGAIAVVELNRPSAGNTINMALALSLTSVVEAIAADDTVRCVVLTGVGKLFCGGGDIGEMAEAGDEASSFLLKLATVLHDSIEKLSKMNKPLVVLVNGPAAGAGMSLAMSGDIVLAARSAHFTAAYSGIGLTPDGGMSWLLPRLVGLRRAQEIILTNRRIASSEAEEIGLVTRVVDYADLRAEGMAIAAALAAGPVSALGGAKHLLASAQTNDLTTQLVAEANRISEAGAEPEAREGVAAFRARRQPRFADDGTLPSGKPE